MFGVPEIGTLKGNTRGEGARSYLSLAHVNNNAQHTMCSSVAGQERIIGFFQRPMRQ